jgi:26S proteasome regulatory subunit N1
VQKQLASILGRQRISVETDNQELIEIMSNSHLSENFIALGRDLNVLDPKLPEDIYKRHLENVRAGMSSVNLDSAKQNLASTFVNAFINAGFGTDKLMLTEEDSNWIYKNKDHGIYPFNN